ncbi:glycosyltransferase [Caballeronia sp. dw_276]|uniref:glycosyltransferase n=1 Tax=Caballeronia sp. dw_276 TaxID=2719795 RepID=UPI0021042F7F|nr:glycosyltransferase [Caballeronia sp. dw_276]
MSTDSISSRADIWYDATRPEVSIVILNWNKAQLTINCVKSLMEHTHGARYEIIVVDNGSRAEEYALLCAFEGPHRVLRLAVNRFFGEGNNLGSEMAKGEFVVFMNNDVTVNPDWLGPLIEIFRVEPLCGAAGPKFVYPHGVLQEAGALLDEQGDAVQIGKFQDPSDPRFNRMRVVDYVSAACVAMRKKVFDRVLGFDFIYEPAYYEDVDLCLKVGALGLKTFYVPQSCIVHHENATTGDPSNGLDLSGLVALNRAKLVDRWAHFLRTGRHLEATPSATAPNLTAAEDTRLSAAIYTARRIDNGEASRFLFSIVFALHALGYRISIVTPERISPLRINQVGEALGFPIPPLQLLPAAQMHSPVEVLVTLDGASEQTEVIRRLARKCYRFVDSVADMSFVDNSERLIVSASRALAMFVDEIDIEAGAARVHVIKPAVIPGRFTVERSRMTIISAGPFTDDAASSHHSFMIEAFRSLVKRGYHAELHFVGSMPPDSASRRYFAECRALAADLPVHFHLDSPQAIRRAVLEGASIYWHAGEDSRFGLNVIEAMSSGAIPIVRRDTLNSPDVAAGVNGFSFSTEAELCGLSEQLFNASDDAIAQLRTEARAEADRHSMQAFTQAWQALLA